MNTWGRQAYSTLGGWAGNKNGQRSPRHHARLVMLVSVVLWCAWITPEQSFGQEAPAAPEGASAQGPTSGQLDELQKKIQGLEQEVQTMHTDLAAVTGKGGKPGFNYKGVNIQLGGFLAAETVYRNHNMESDIATPFSKIPFPNVAGYHESEFRGTARQSRLSLLVQGDVTPTTHLAGYYELDFLGAAPTANPNQSNSFNPRTRNVYLTVDWDTPGLHLLAGQNWSLVTMNANGITPRSEYIPQTIDAQYAVGFNWERQWQLRIAKDWNKMLWAAISAENSQTVGVGGLCPGGGTACNTYQLPAGSNFSTGTNLSINRWPDFIAKAALESAIGHYEVYSLTRNFQSKYGGTTTATQTNNQSTWTEAVGAGVIIPVLPTHVDVALSGLYGKGVGRYGTTQLSDATFAGDGSLEPLTGFQYLAQLAWHASRVLEVWVAYGQEQVDASVGPGGAYGYGGGIVASNAGCETLGGVCSPLLKGDSQINGGFWWSIFKGNYGALKLGVQYSHTKLETYGDAASFSPSTSEDMIFSSLRYYPF